MRFLLVNPPIREHCPPSQFPLGLGYIASTVRNSGFQVNVLDINGYRFSLERVTKKIAEWNYGAVGITGLITQYSYIKWLCNILRKTNPNCWIIVGGAIASSIPDTLLAKTECDIVVYGEGEITVVELANTIQNNGHLRAVKGISFKDRGKIIRNLPREPIKDLGSLPFPAWELFPMETYIGNLGREKIACRRALPKQMERRLRGNNLRAMTISAVRGCPYQCSYCYHTFYGYPVRNRPIKSVIDEILTLKREYGIHHVDFNDDIFVHNRKWTVELCRALIKLGRPVTWICAGRVNLIDAELLSIMKKAGCVYIGYGIESGSDRILKLMNKKVTAKQASEAVKLTQKMNFACGASFMIGYPGETKASIKETVRFCIDHGIHLSFFYTTPYPGTPLYNWTKSVGKIKNEEEYFEHLSKIGDAKNLAINLTDFTDDELVKLKEESELEVMKANKNIHRKVLRVLRREGLSGLFKRILHKFLLVH